MCQTPKQNTILKLEKVYFSLFTFPSGESCHILLLSNILDFVPAAKCLLRVIHPKNILSHVAMYHNAGSTVYLFSEVYGLFEVLCGD